MSGDFGSHLIGPRDQSKNLETFSQDIPEIHDYYMQELHFFNLCKFIFNF